ncbi:alpha/beta fold hydrolase [Paramicrobacterium fandaimingii]|uniref:alpha/beta fold hydrolase n=1 Tax=Paramicrobacterium fandaimingii TaxID=2708079 RepID=UPI00142281BE|nr:alpha/beta hydrolase [Microbacterium fandaimingii]
MAVTDHSSDEFRFRVEEAAEFGIPLPLLPAMRTNDVDDDGRRLGIIRYGTGDPEVIFLHGAGLNAHTWDATAASLNAPAAAVDLPGHGASEWRDDADYRPETIAAALAPVIDRIDGRHIFVGQSLGGLAAALVSAQDSATKGLLLVDITPDVSTGDAAQIAAFLAQSRDFASRDEIVDGARAAGIGVSRDSVARGVALNTREQDDGRVVFAHHLAHLGGLQPSLTSDRERLWNALENLTVPTWLVRARRGIVTEELARGFAARLPRSRVIEIDTGHNVQEDDPVALARIVAELLRSSDTRSPAPHHSDA